MAVYLSLVMATIMPRSWRRFSPVLMRPLSMVHHALPFDRLGKPYRFSYVYHDVSEVQKSVG